MPVAPHAAVIPGRYLYTGLYIGFHALRVASCVYSDLPKAELTTGVG